MISNRRRKYRNVSSSFFPYSQKLLACERGRVKSHSPVSVQSGGVDGFPPCQLLHFGTLQVLHVTVDHLRTAARTEADTPWLTWRLRHPVFPSLHLFMCLKYRVHMPERTQHGHIRVTYRHGSMLRLRVNTGYCITSLSQILTAELLQLRLILTTAFVLL